MNIEKLNNYLENKAKGKTELATQKIELAAPQFKDYEQKAQRIYLDARNQAQKELMAISETLDKGDRELIGLSKELNAQIEKVARQAREIGIDIKETSLFSSMKKATQSIFEYEASFKNAITKAKSLKL